MKIEVNISRLDSKDFTVDVMKNLGRVIKSVTLKGAEAKVANRFFIEWLRALEVKIF